MWAYLAQGLAHSCPVFIYLKIYIYILYLNELYSYNNITYKYILCNIYILY